MRNRGKVVIIEDSADEGELTLEGEPIRELGEEARMKLRERRLGFVFAGPFLLPAFTVGLAAYIAVLEGAHFFTRRPVFLCDLPSDVR